ncbi:putative DNA pilot protein [Dragonfly-associated microphage 1]|uniref:putative DNA pilot protein n=1 Tax=Dragonfly-associated microphage 1 TaxID=1234888 RepID=UPI00028AD59C|nr:putative DNA pilot protein [Dragonfly-associated microphage 1]AFS65319.1 putative DNA pilot protein [Dragonfly-associated microphage 1]
MVGIAAAQTATDILGARMTNRSNERQMRANIEYQREFAQHGIRWRVEDAKAAGLHPLYALGAQTPSFSPVMYQDAVGDAVARGGQNIGNAVMRAMDSKQREAQELSLELLRSQIRETDARGLALLSEAARGRQGANEAAPMPPLNVTREGSLEWALSRFPQDRKGIGIGPAPSVEPGDSNFRRDTHQDVTPFWREFHFGNGRIVLPTSSDDPAQALESVNESYALMWAVYQENKARYGQAWADQVANKYFVPDVWQETKRYFRDKYREWRKSDRSGFE